MLARILPRAAARGFSAATRPYGLLLDHIEWAFVDGWAFMGPRRVPPLRGVDIGDQRSWDRLVDGSVELRRRLSASSRVFERYIWRAEVQCWYQQDRPESIAYNALIARTDVAALHDTELVRHLITCRINLANAIRRHHRYDVTPAVAVGDLLAHVAEWTGSLPTAHPELLASPSRRALAVTELLAVAGGWWIAGSTVDLDELCYAELTGPVADALRAGAPPAEPDEEAEDSALRVRARIPGPCRAEFDEMVADARAAQRVRDQRALYCDVWAMGLLRRAVLEIGARLCGRGVLESPAGAVEAGPAELRALLLRPRSRGAALEEMRVRGEARRHADSDAVPDELGDPPWAPIPLQWLPAGTARTERAFRTFLAAMEEDSEPSATDDLRGLPASPGVHAGRARIVRRADDLARVEAGDVLVAPAASPSLVVAFCLAGALVTDHGGMLSHAAIVARERGIPAVVATGDATNRVHDGDQLRVDGGAGVVAIARR